MKNNIEIKLVDTGNFTESSMDSFDRFQEVRNVYRIENGRLVLKNHPFTESLSFGRRMIETVKDYAKNRGAEALYASCCSSEETITFYMAMGFRPSAHPIPFYVENEPFDIQMELKL